MSTPNVSADTPAAQLAQLDALHAAGVLDARAHAQGRAHLTGAKASRLRWAVDPLLVAALVAGLLVVGLGAFLIDRDRQPAARATAPQDASMSGTAPHATDAVQVRAMVAGLEQRLARRPVDAEGWGMLARSWTVLGENEKALAAYRRALPLAPTDAVLRADFADALAASQGQRIEGESLKLVEQALALDPDQPKALSLAGTAAFNQGDFAGAVRHWGHLQAVGPPDHPLVRQMAAGLAEARERAGIAAVAGRDKAGGPARP